MICSYCGSDNVIDTIIYNKKHKNYCIKCKHIAQKEKNSINRIKRLKRAVLINKIKNEYSNYLKDIANI